MAIRNIVTEGDEVLRKRSREVTDFNEKLWLLLDDMKDTVKNATGAGLAAVQVGILKRAVVVDVEEGFFEFINPKIVSFSGEQDGVEGCLSVPKIHGNVSRPLNVKVKAFDRYGQEFTIKAKEFFARAICHELDHLDGILYIDKAKDIKQD